MSNRSTRMAAAANSPDVLAPPPLIGSSRCASASSAALPLATSITDSHLGRVRGRASAKPTICRCLETNDGPKPDGSSSGPGASTRAVTAAPPQPAFSETYVPDPCQSRWTAACRADLVVEARSQPRGGLAGGTSCLLQQPELERLEWKPDPAAPHLRGPNRH